ncbi:hypothetical protein MVES1_000345 [Malassezia vespertilionis]|uniref:Ketoreductase domain-containing protein n=1 Tax=Malassezia vespertilionis TaxID=2020962 RepID=A0A2N1JG51_9BASI|nr:uncharacterized protein MVES1_000345 [Malassezia vespertilionis]PKI85519.1 hypothetical protein MVES_000325 [Malassezia vespertilionis]WFD05020.1 hypothetical protein MVES1_000345 [Malassezia vespertilionis]
MTDPGPHEEDPLSGISERICDHMNKDHYDAVAQLAMYFFKLPELPRWMCMQSIRSTAMVISYSMSEAHDEAESVPISETIPIDPPITTIMEARKRLVAMNKMSEEENAKRLRQRLPNAFIDVHNMDRILSHLTALFMHPVSIGLLAVTVMFLIKPLPEEPSRSWIAWPLRCLHTFYQSHCLFFAFLALLCGFVVSCRIVRKLDMAWQNAAPVPPLGSIPAWIQQSLTTGPLPKLDSTSWPNETVVITGGARGLGAALAKSLAEKGASVIVYDLAKMTVKHPNIFWYLCDVSNVNDVFAKSAEVVAQHGAPTMLINNAGVRHGSPLLDESVAEISRILNTNTMSHFWTLKALLPFFIEKKRGHIVSTSSMMGHVGVAQMIDYVASKHALVGLHASLRSELDTVYKTPFVRTTLVCPGHLQETSMFAGIQYNVFARFFAPTVSVQRVVDQIVHSLEHQQSSVISMPWYVPWAPLLRTFPQFVQDGIHNVRNTHEN